tara:strand:- start:10061 stop:10441 length:381 start_codon:yes stop_codon:yes gene_type:complete
MFDEIKTKLDTARGRNNIALGMGVLLAIIALILIVYYGYILATESGFKDSNPSNQTKEQASRDRTIMLIVLFIVFAFAIGITIYVISTKTYMDDGYKSAHDGDGMTKPMNRVMNNRTGPGGTRVQS